MKPHEFLLYRMFLKALKRAIARKDWNTARTYKKELLRLEERR
jgi:hypothetical protein